MHVRTACDADGGRAWPRRGRCYNSPVYARKLRVDVIVGGERRPCPIEWLDSFCMRNFTRDAAFDDTLPLADGLMEASLRVKIPALAEALSAWLTGRGKGDGKPVLAEITQERAV